MYLKVRLSIAIILMIKVQGLSLWTRTTSWKARIIEVDISAFWAVFLARVKLITSRDSSPFNNAQNSCENQALEIVSNTRIKAENKTCPASIIEISVLNMFIKNEKCIIVSMRLCNDALSTLTLPISKCSSLMNFRK